MDKSVSVQDIFSSIAEKYDLSNRLLSFGIDIYWRKFAIKKIKASDSGKILDVATGTADVALDIAKKTSDTIKILGIDFNEKMLAIGQDKVDKSAYSQRISLQCASAEDLPFEDNTFDSAIISFGIRNVVNRLKGLQEMARVVKKGGQIVVLEFTTPPWTPFRWLYFFYLNHLLPHIGGFVTGDKSAYQYLATTIAEFPKQEEFKKIMEEVGLREVKYFNLTLGIAAVHVGTK